MVGVWECNFFPTRFSITTGKFPVYRSMRIIRRRANIIGYNDGDFKDMTINEGTTHSIW